MKAILDVRYEKGRAIVACVRFRNWSDSRPAGVRITEVEVQADYVPGRFFERELPCLLHALKQERTRFEVIVIDGYVHLKPPLRKGLGRHLAEALPYPAVVVGVAKNPLKIADRFLSVYRGRSRRPLFVSAIHISTERAGELIQGMEGPFRSPALIKRADQLSRGHGAGAVPLNHGR